MIHASPHFIHIGYFAVHHFALEWLHDHCSVCASESSLAGRRKDLAFAYGQDLDNRYYVPRESALTQATRGNKGSTQLDSPMLPTTCPLYILIQLFPNVLFQLSTKI